MSLTAVQSGAYLHHLAFESPSPQRLAEFYAATLGMPLHRAAAEEWRCEGPRRKMIFVPGERRKMAYAGFALRDADGAEALRARAASEGITILPSPSPYLREGAFAVRDPNGQCICFGLAAAGEEPAPGIHGPLQHVTFASTDLDSFVDFYHRRLGFAITDRVLRDNGDVATVFVTSNYEHHTIACFLSDRNGVDHHSYEAGEWNTIRDWCDHFASLGISLMWGPGRHGPGNNLFAFIEDPDGNWIEISAELEIIHDRPMKDWPHAEKTLNLWGRAIMRS
jgi:catechol 2,3-dioxygenase-like lactoylglutathione lyase family enzyme